ncbi:sortase [Paenibacillus glacialis]|uniref:Sortase n=2 Tax=Paenibacillus glacialis TaxID=494026 RepID=A0A168P2H4_9BACL|nr:sortase [Paenibacillus glacialis]
MKSRNVSLLFIVIGIIMLCYPKLSEMYENYQQEKLVREWQISLQNIDNGADSSQSINGDVLSDNIVTDNEVNDLYETNVKLDSSNNENMEGILYIKRINLQLPILHGATKSNMKTSVASIVNTGQLGEVGNYALAGHRNRTFGRNLNRLDELEQGDKIQIDNGEDQFEYTVMEKLRVTPEEVWVLEGVGSDRELTLVTCDPMINPTHRLIIKAKIIE